MITCLIGVAVALSCAYAPGGPLSALAARTVALETRTRRRRVVVFMIWHSVGLGSDSAPTTAAAVPLQRAAAVCPRCVTRSGLFCGNLMNIRKRHSSRRAQCDDPGVGPQLR